MPSRKNVAGLLALGAAATVGAHPLQARATTSNAATYNGCMYNVDGNYNFTDSLSVDFTTISAVPSTLTASTQAIGGSPAGHQFTPDNIAFVGDSVALTVPGGQSGTVISSAEMRTAATDILYGSVRTVARISNVAGTTQAFSFYSNDYQETDFAFLTYNINNAHFTNEQTSSSSPYTSYTGSAPSDASTAFHEYRLDWTPSKTEFYIDGTLIRAITQNVPSQAGFWLWNNWSNGNGWTQGPPASDNTLYIQSIQAYFNRTSSATTVAQNSQCAALLHPSSSSTRSSTTSSRTSTSAAPATTSTSTSHSSTAVSSTTSAASTATGQVQPYGQCGGINYSGATQCTSGWTCQYQNDFYYQCVQAASTSSSAPATTSSTSVRATSTTLTTTTSSGSATTCNPAQGTQSAYGQCGGTNWTGATCCTNGWTCQYQNDFYYQCVQAANTPAAVTTSTSTRATTSSTSVRTTSTTPSTTTSSASATTCDPARGTQTAYGQCGGTNWTGATCCTSGWRCQYQNDFYYQCVQ